MPRLPRTRLALEHLETRETPSLSATEPFNTIAPPALPAGWGEWSNDGSDVFQTAAAQGDDHPQHHNGQRRRQKGDPIGAIPTQNRNLGKGKGQGPDQRHCNQGCHEFPTVPHSALPQK